MLLTHVNRKGPRRVVALWVALLVASSCTTAALAAATATQPTKPAGAWSGSYTGGSSGTFTLHWRQTGSSLRGKIALSNPHGTYNITGSVNGTKINFGAASVGAVYTGSLSRSGLSMSGIWTSGTYKGTWRAHKVKS